MQTELIQEQYQGLPVHIVVDKRSGDILFDASHTCGILGYARDASNVVEKLDDDEKVLLSRADFDPTVSVGSNCDRHFDLLFELASKGGAQKKWFVTEPGLYKLIMGSQKEGAKPFQRWVTHEVLPAIRKTGQYSTGKVNLVKIERTHSLALKIAKAQGLGLAIARKTAAHAVKNMHGVDIYEFLGIPSLADEDTAREDNIKILKDAWKKHVGAKPITTKELIRIADNCAELRQALLNLVEKIDAKTIGYFLRKSDVANRGRKTNTGMLWDIGLEGN